jgi:acyl-CoA thioesterase-2
MSQEAAVKDVLGELVELLELERLEQDLFRGQSQDLGWGTVFGGQVLGQALSAASKTVPAERPVHSLHGYFLRPGDVSKPIIYEVDRIRDGGSFTTRRVVAIQNGAPIFNMSASFQLVEDGLAHQTPRPNLPGPDGLMAEHELARKLAAKIPSPLREMATAERPIEARPIAPQNPLVPDKRPPERNVWYRAMRELPDDPSLHYALLAYASDFNFLTTALQPHGLSWLSANMQVTSLDHAMWFHGPLRMDSWLLHVMESPWAGGARGLVRGHFYDERGVLVASTVQEGLMRQRSR